MGFPRLETAVLPKGLLSEFAREEAKSGEVDANSVKSRVIIKGFINWYRLSNCDIQ